MLSQRCRRWSNIKPASGQRVMFTGTRERWSLWCGNEELILVPPHYVIRASSAAVQSLKAVTAYFTSEQLLRFGFADQSSAGLLRRTQVMCTDHELSRGLTILFSAVMDHNDPFLIFRIAYTGCWHKVRPTRLACAASIQLNLLLKAKHGRSIWSTYNMCYQRKKKK